MDVLFYSPPVVENIFKHLGARDLSVCGEVCKLWNSMSAIELKRRTHLSWFFQNLVCLEHAHTFCSEHYGRMCSRCTVDFSAFEAGLQKQLNELRIKPAFCIALASYPCLENFGKLFPSFVSSEPDKKKSKNDKLHKRSYLHSVIKTALKPYLPASTGISFAVAPGIIGSHSDYSVEEIEDGSTMTGFFLPKMKGVEIHHFAVDNQKWNLTDLVPREASVKCVLVFITPRGNTFVSNFVQSCLVREECKVAVGGAMVDRTESLLGSAIAFCGENVEAASLIINPKDKKEELKKKLQIFQESGLLKNRCFAFMFACVARGYQFYRNYDFESSTFRSLYPRVPLIGVFGNGEIGVNYFPHLPTEKKVFPKGKLPCVKTYLHSYTTVFVLVSVKD